jgi:DNA-binding XRE family transcriptional regulator
VVTLGTASDIRAPARPLLHSLRNTISELPYRYGQHAAVDRDNRAVAVHRRGEPTWDEFGREIGLRLQRARERRGLSQERTAHLAGIAAYTYQKFEKGESRPGSPLNPRLSTLVALCQVLEVSLQDLVPEPAPSVELDR